VTKLPPKSRNPRQLGIRDANFKVRTAKLNRLTDTGRTPLIQKLAKPVRRRRRPIPETEQPGA